MFRKIFLLSVVSFGFAFSVAEICRADAASDLSRVEAYVKSGQFSQAEGLCSSIEQNNPGTDYALKAQGKLAVIYIMTGKMSQADGAAETLINTHKSNAELPAILYGIVLRFKQAREFERAQKLSQRICQEFPKSEQTQRIQLDSGKEHALAFIEDGRFEQAEAAVNSLVTTSSNNPAIPATLFKIAREFKESGRYDETMRIYQKIVQDYPNSEVAGKSRMGIDKLQIWNLIKAGDVTGAQAALDKLINDYRDNGDLPHTVHGVALQLEEAGFYQQAKALYEKVKQDYADDPIATKAAVDMKKCDIRAMVGKSSFSEVSQQIDALRQSFPDNGHVSLAIFRIGEEYYKKGIELESQGSAEQAKTFYQNAVNVCDVVISKLPSSSATPEACRCAGVCYGILGDYEKANACFQNAVDNFPGCRMRSTMMFKIAQNYKRMKKAGTVSATEADGRAAAMYERLLTEYPSSKVADYARKQSGR